VLEFEHPNRHQIAAVDEFTVARIHRLWEDWLRASPPERRNKHQFYRQVIRQDSQLAELQLATVYVLLARMDAHYADQMSPVGTPQ